MSKITIKKSMCTIEVHRSLQLCGQCAINHSQTSVNTTIIVILCFTYLQPFHEVFCVNDRSYYCKQHTIINQYATKFFVHIEFRHIISCIQTV